ncbi:MAG: plasmid mobilization protein [Longimicrobiales bacterium]
MSIRLQVVMSEAEHEEIRQAAERERLTVSEWVRRTLRDARTRHPAGPTVVREPRPAYAGSSEEPTHRVRVEMELDEELLEAVRRRYRQPSWRAAVEYALRRASVTPMGREEALAMRGAGWEGDLEALRSGDPGHPL